MSYTTPPTAKAAGDPVEATDFNNYRDNIDDHETRMNALETGAAVLVIVDTDIHNLVQYANSASTLEGLIHFQAKQNMTLNSAIITDLVGSTSGSHEFDLLVSTTGISGTFNSVMSTLASVSSVTPAESVNGAFLTVSISAQDWLRIDITSIAVGAKSINIAVNASTS